MQKQNLELAMINKLEIFKSLKYEVMLILSRTEKIGKSKSSCVLIKIESYLTLK